MNPRMTQIASGTRERQVGDDQAPVGAEQARLAHDHEQRDHEHDEREHLRHQHEHQQDARDRHAIARERVGGQRADDRQMTIVPLATISEFSSARPTWPSPSTRGYWCHCGSDGHRSGVRV